MALARGYLWFCAIMSVVFGGIYLLAPALMTEPMGIGIVTPAGATDLRATYGGFQLGMGAFLLWSLRDPVRVRIALVAFFFVMAGLALCRSVGLLLDGLSGSMAGAAAFELGLAVFTGFVLQQLDRETDAVAPVSES